MLQYYSLCDPDDIYSNAKATIATKSMTIAPFSNMSVDGTLGPTVTHA